MSLAMKHVTIVMYHFVRELPYTRYPKIKGLLKTQFEEQLAYISKYYEFVKIEDCINAVYSEDNDFPPNAILLTFDDAYIDHFTTVFPLLEAKGVQACFFPPAKAILNNEVLDVNKIHFLLAAASNIDTLLDDVYACLNEYRAEYNLKSNDYYFSKFAHANRFDSKEIIFIKHLLQRELEEEPRKLILDKLFKKYVTNDETSFSRELYMSVDQMRCMARNGMYIGSHGYDHYWLNTLQPEKQEKEIDLSLDFLKELGSPIDNWVMCYPHGAYNDSLLEILQKKQCKLALTTKAGIALLCKEKALILKRLDTNDLPKVANAQPNIWTKKILH